MSKYNQLRTLSFRLAVDTLPCQYYTLQFPGIWAEHVRRLQSRIWGREADQVRIPIDTLNRALRSLVPGLIAIGKNVGWGNSSNTIWLYALEPIDPVALLMVVQAWATVELDRADDAALKELIQSFHSNELVWKPAQIDLAEWGVAENGTALPRGQNSNAPFLLLPEFLASRLVESDQPLMIHGRAFRRGPARWYGDAAVELIAWPPREHEKRGQKWPYSEVLALSVQTVPFQPWPVVYCDVGIRRWAVGSPVQIPWNQRTNVFVSNPLRWIPQSGLSPRFQVAAVERRFVKSADSTGGGWKTMWADKLAKIVNALHQPDPALPDPEDLLRAPRHWLTDRPGSVAAVSFRYGMKPAHWVMPGAGPEDRQTILHELEQRLEGVLKLSDMPQRIGERLRHRPPTNPFFELRPDSLETKDPSMCRTAVASSFGTELNLEIWFDTEYVRNALIKAIQDIFGLGDPDTIEPMRWHMDNLTITCVARPIGKLASPLDLEPSGGSFKERAHQAINRRRQELGSAMTTTPQITGALVELRERDAAGHDPKQALRLGFASANRVTQFILNNDIDLLYRARMSVLDLLRQMGVLHAPLRFAFKQLLVPRIHYIGLWLVKQNAWRTAKPVTQTLPVLVRLTSDDTRVWAMVSDSGQWMPYPDALVALARGQYAGIDNPKQALPVMRQMLEREVRSLPHDEPVLLLAHALNLRSSWPWLNNGHIRQDRLALDNRDYAVEEWPGLRVVRVRDATGHETPEWYAQSDEEIGFAKGLFRINDRTFASTHSKPKQFRKMRRDTSKLSAEAEPAQLLWNPGLMELTVPIVQAGDEPWHWAALAHELRLSATHYDEATALPLPLHFAKQMSDYVLSLPDGLEDD